MVRGVDARRRRRPRPPPAPSEHARAPGLRAWRRTATAGRHEHGEHQQAAEPLHRHRERGGEQHQQREPHRAPARRQRAAPPRGRTRRRAAGGAARPGRRRRAAAERRRGGQVGVAHAERIAEQQLLQARRGVRATGPAARRARTCPVTTTAVAVSAPIRSSRAASATSAAATATPRAGAEQQRRAGQRGQHQAGQQAVRQRLRRVAQPVARDPERQRAAEARRAARPRAIARRSMPERHGSSRGSSSVHQCSWCWTVIARSGPPSSLEDHDLAAVGLPRAPRGAASRRAARRPPGGG